MSVQVGYTQDEWNAVQGYPQRNEEGYLDFAFAVLAHGDDVWSQGWTSTGLADAIIDTAIQRLTTRSRETDISPVS